MTRVFADDVVELGVVELGEDVGDGAGDVGERQQAVGAGSASAGDVVVEVVDRSHGADGGEAHLLIEVIVDAPVLVVVVEAAGIAAEIVVGQGGGIAGRGQEGRHPLRAGVSARDSWPE